MSFLHILVVRIWIIYYLCIVMVLFNDISKSIKYYQNIILQLCSTDKTGWKDIKNNSWQRFLFWGNFPFTLHPRMISTNAFPRQR